MSLCSEQSGFHVKRWVPVPLQATLQPYQNSCETSVVSLTQRFISLTNRATPEPELPRLPCITLVSRFIVWAFACWTDSMEGETTPLQWSYYRTSSQDKVNVQRSQAASFWMTRLPSALFWHAQETRLAAVNAGDLSLHAVNSKMRGWLKVWNLPCPSLTFDLSVSRLPTVTPQCSALGILGVTNFCRISM